MRAKIGVGHASVGELEKRYVNLALDAGRLSQGEFVYRFEKEFGRLHDQQHGIACNSGTSALHVALEGLKEQRNWPDGGEVLVPAITFIASSNACIHAGLKPVFVDVDPGTYNIAVEAIEARISPKTVAVMPVHTFGQPCEMGPILQVARKHGLAVVEDCSEAHFATYKGKPVASFGDISAFSTYVAHTITTGIGGVITTNDPDLADISRSLVAHGRACTCEKCIASNPAAVCKRRMETDIDRRFMMVRMGYSYRVGELEGALGLAQLEGKDAIMSARKRNAAYLSERLAPFGENLQLPRYPDYVEHSFMMYPLVVRAGTPFDRKKLVEFLEGCNIESRPMLPLLNQPVYRRLFGDIEKDYPVAEWINRSGFYIGCHHGLELGDLEYIAECFQSFFDTL